MADAMKPSNLFDSRPVIKVVGVGGAGCNAVNRMVEVGLEGVEFIAANTDEQALRLSCAPVKLQLGVNTTRGLGAGGDPRVGEAAAKESERAIADLLDGADMLFITCGFGGGTGTGAAPVVAAVAQRLGILTVSVGTRPFDFEGPIRSRMAEQGIVEIRDKVDTLIVVPNEKLLTVADKKATLAEAFLMADDVLRQGVQGIGQVILEPGLVNLDFADVRSVMYRAGVATMGIGRATGEGRAKLAAQSAANSPLLETTIRGAKKMLVCFATGPDFSLFEVQEAMDYLQQFADPEEASVYFGHVVRPDGDEVQITLLASGIGTGPGVLDEKDVFGLAERRRESRMPSPTQEPDEIDLDIATFLRRQRQG